MKHGLRSMKSFKHLMALAVLAGATARAGQPIYVFVPQDNSLVTTTDDRMLMTPLKWYDGAEPKFYVVNPSDGSSDYLIDPTLVGTQGDGYGVNTPNVLHAMNEAIATWNNARWGSFKFSDSVGKASAAPSAFTPYGRYQPSAVALDGFNIISNFTDDALIDNNQPGVVQIGYFIRDFDLSNPYNPRFASPYSDIQLISNNGGTTNVDGVDVNGDGEPDLFLPARKYKAGDIFDTDIVISQAAAAWVNIWPDSEGDVPSNLQTHVPGSLDLQAMMTYLFGQARGLANSMIIDASMNPTFNGGATGTGIDFPEQPYRRRKLSYDDQLAVGFQDGSNFGDGAVISGQVIEGSRVEQQTADFTYTVDDLVVQAPMFLLSRPDAVNHSDILSGGRDSLAAGESPDDVVSTPFDTTTVDTAGTWRRIAQVLTGRNLLISNGANSNYFTPLPDLGTGNVNAGGGANFPTGGSGGATQGGGNAGNGTGTGTGAAIAAVPYERLNSVYAFAGLPATSDQGTTIPYAVRIENNTTETPDPVFTFFQTNRAETYTDEYWGGNPSLLPINSGNVVRATTANDTVFTNSYLAVNVNEQGRCSAILPDATEILSGFDTDPTSWFEITGSDGTVSNRYTNIAAQSRSLRISDGDGTADAEWTQAGKFRISMHMALTEQGGEIGVPDGVRVTYSILNIGDQPATYTLRQVLDAYLLGSQNPVYVVDNKPVDQAQTFTGNKIPNQMYYQTSYSNPAESSFITMRGYGMTPPSAVTIANLNDLAAHRKFSGGGYAIRGLDSQASDTGVQLEWDGLAMQPQEGRTVSFIVGFYRAGMVYDGWAPETQADADSGALAAGMDDPEQIRAITLKPGEIRDDIDIYTNTGTIAAGAATTPVDTGALTFRLVDGGFPNTEYVATDAALADFDLDGDLDLVTAGMRGTSEDVVASGINRLYENRQRIEPDGTVSYYFADVTFGPDGIPYTDDDKLPNADRQTMGVAVGDFDLDGDIDIFFSNQGSANQFFVNVGYPGHLDIAGKFDDVSDIRLPGLLNRATGRQWDGGLGLGLQDPLTWDVSSKVTAGDIDGDGDLDLIISEIVPFTDELYDNSGTMVLPESQAWTDIAPNNGDRRPNSFNDLWSDTLYWSERVLVNMTRVPAYQRNKQIYGDPYFADQTLGRDNRAGVMTNYYNAATGSLKDPLRDAPFNVSSLSRTMAQDLGDAIDRMPPLFPVMAHVNSRAQESDPITPTIIASPMGGVALKPILAPFFGDTSLDLFSIRTTYPASNSMLLPESLQDTPAPAFHNTERVISVSVSPTQYTGSDMGMYRNTDVFSNQTGIVGQDGINDGYFACVNYNMDVGISGTNSDIISSPVQSAGLYVYQLNPEATGTDMVVSDVIPLMIGLPASVPGNRGGGDLLAAPLDTENYSGLIADWFNRGAPRPLVLGSNGSAPYVYDSTNNNYPGGHGYVHGQIGTDFNEDGIAYYRGYLYPFTGWQNASAMSPTALTQTTTALGRDVSGAAGDFDRDGDQDFFVATTISGNAFASSGAYSGLITTAEEPSNQLFINDGLGNFSEVTQTGLLPHTPSMSLATVTGDIDNDGDLDLVVINGRSPNQLFRNDTFTNPPDITSDDDRPMFYEDSASYIPPLGSAGWGVSTKITTADFDSDGKPDLAVTNGGVFDVSGDSIRLFYNRGSDRMDPGVSVFQPIGSDHPAPFLSNAIYLSNTGLLTSLAAGDAGSEANGLTYPLSSDGSAADISDYFNDTEFADLDNDGDPDMVQVSGSISEMQAQPLDTGPRIFKNVDSNATEINSVPDGNSLGDGLFVYDAQAMPPLEDLQNVYLDSITLKKQGRRVTFADVNHDGLLDILVANGFSGGGAPNLLLLNKSGHPGVFDDKTDGPGGYLPVQEDLTEKPGIMDNTVTMAAADFENNGNIQIIYINRSNAGAPIGWRFLDNAEVNPGTPNAYGQANGHYVDVTGRFKDANGNLSDYQGTDPRAIAVADFDGLGEVTEDKNHNGHLDPDEDIGVTDADGNVIGAGNGIIDWLDRPTETEDLNGNGVIDGNEDVNHNGVLDPGEDLNHNGELDFGEDVGVYGPDGTLIGANDGEVTTYDANNDGIITARVDGQWDGSLDFFVTFDDDVDRIFINDPTNIHPGNFSDMTLSLFPTLAPPEGSRGVDVGDVNLDGLPDIVIAQHKGGITNPARLWINKIVKLPNGKVRRGVFENRTSEIPLTRVYHEDGETPGSNPDATVIFPSDVKLLDIDGDGDLDMVLCGQGNLLGSYPIGAPELTYINRLIGAGFRHESRVNQTMMVNPTVLQVQPSGAKPGTTAQFTVYGQNFARDVAFSFGPGVSLVSVDSVTATYTTSGTTNVQLVNMKSNPLPPDIDFSQIENKGWSAVVTLSVAPDAPLGGRAVVVQNPTGGATATKPGVFTVYTDSPNPYHNAADGAWTLYE